MGTMPIIDVTYAPEISKAMLHELGSLLPHLVSRAVECPEEPYDGQLRPGDAEVRFHRRSSYDPGGLGVVIEVRSKWFESRAANRQERADKLYAEIESETGLRDLGVYLALPAAAWSQGE